MGEWFSILSYYIQGKPIFGPLRKVLDLLLSFNIAFLAWDKFYGPIRWDQYDEYGEIMDFVLRGGFFIPTCILLLSHFSIKLTGRGILKLNRAVNNRVFKRALGKVTFFGPNPDGAPNQLGEAFASLASDDVDRGKLIAALSKIKEEDLQAIKKWENQSADKRLELQENFDVAWKLFVAAVLFKATIPGFEGVLFLLTTIFAQGAMSISSVLIQILEKTPELIKKFAAEAEQYLQKAQELKEKEINNDEAVN